MIINGRKIADTIYGDLKIEIKKLGKKPTLGAILVGDNAASATYIKQKQKWADFVGINFILKKFPDTITEKDLLTEIQDFNDDRNVDGFIVQLPLPKHICNSRTKKIDAFTRKADVVVSAAGSP